MKSTSPCLPGFLTSCLFLAAGAAVAVMIGWFAAKLNSVGWAPIGLLPLIVGVILGVAVSRMAMALRIACSTRLLIGALVVAFVTVLSEHAWLYREFCRQWTEARAANPQVALFRSETPWSLTEYFTREATPNHVATWVLDGVMIVASAVMTVRIMHPCSRSASQVTPLTESPPLNSQP